MCQGLLEVIASTMKMLQGSVGLLLPKIPLITFDVPVDPPYEQIGTQVTNSSTKNSQPKAEHQSVSKIEAGLEKAGHLGLHIIVVYRVEVDIDSS